MKTKIKWKDGSRFNCTATEAYRFFQRIQDDNDGNLDLDDAVHKSKPKGAPLHNDLEWNNAKCGDLWRRDQMRRIVRRIEVVRPNLPNTRAYESVKVEIVDSEAKDETVKTVHVMRKTEDLLANPDTRADLLTQAMRDLAAWRRRYVGLSELAKVVEVIDETIDKAGRG